uniref:Uncharacterized protein n=1 Tax=Romanomermis culicivorax TaxID=13658 RepID=A0A915L5H8_ROMCU
MSTAERAQAVVYLSANEIIKEDLESSSVSLRTLPNRSISRLFRISRKIQKTDANKSKEKFPRLVIDKRLIV